MGRITKITLLITLAQVVACATANMPRGYQGIARNQGEALRRTADKILVCLGAMTERGIQTHATRRSLPQKCCN